MLRKISVPMPRRTAVDAFDETLQTFAGEFPVDSSKRGLVYLADGESPLRAFMNGFLKQVCDSAILHRVGIPHLDIKLAAYKTSFCEKISRGNRANFDRDYEEICKDVRRRYLDATLLAPPSPVAADGGVMVPSSAVHHLFGVSSVLPAKPKPRVDRAAFPPTQPFHQMGLARGGPAIVAGRSNSFDDRPLPQ